MSKNVIHRLLILFFHKKKEKLGQLSIHPCDGSNPHPSNLQPLPVTTITSIRKHFEKKNINRFKGSRF